MRRTLRVGCLGLVGLLVLYLIWYNTTPHPQRRSETAQQSVVASNPTGVKPATETSIPPTLDATGQAILATQAWFTQQQTQAAAGLPVNQFELPTTPPTATEYVDYDRVLDDGLFILAGGRDIQSVGLSDYRYVVISYLTTESTPAGYVEEWIDLFEAVAATTVNHDLDIQGVALMMATPTGINAGTITCSIGDLLAFHNGSINRQEFLNRIQVASLFS